MMTPYLPADVLGEASYWQSPHSPMSPLGGQEDCYMALSMDHLLLALL